jgi:hypothetical protein
MDQAMQLYEYNGGSWESAISSDDATRAAFASVLKIQSTGTKPLYEHGSTTYTYSDGSVMNYITMKNGFDIFFKSASPTCTTDRRLNECNTILVDFDGNGKGLDKHVHDIYAFAITKNPSNNTYSITPWAGNTASTYSPINTPVYRCNGIYGYSCAAEILGGLDSQY